MKDATKQVIVYVPGKGLTPMSQQEAAKIQAANPEKRKEQNRK